MIRPFTIATCLLACGSGLYLYQSKHEVQVLDRTIERIVHDTGALREQSRLLAAEWTMLNDPDRLRQFSDTYLSLKTITPTQFASLTDLDARLPAPQAEAPSTGADEPEAAPVVSDANTAVAVDPAAVADEELPVPPIPDAPPPSAVASVVSVAGVAVAGVASAGASTHVASLGVSPTHVASAGVSPTPRPGPSNGGLAPSNGAVAPAGYGGVPLSGNPPAVVATAGLAPTSLPHPGDGRLADRVQVFRPAGDSGIRSVAVAETRPADARGFDPHVGPRSADVRLAAAQPPRPIVLGVARPPLQAIGQPARPTSYAPVTAAPALAQAAGRSPAAPAPAPFTGSLLGMARASMPPAPRPMPVSASYNAN
jgi:hypothetical protein